MGLKNLIIRGRNYISDHLTKSSLEKAIIRRQKRGKVIENEKLIILGCGWGSYSFLKNLNSIKYDITVISPRNHFLFTPLLTSSAVGTLEFRSIAEPVRTTRDINEFKYIQASVTSINPENNSVLVKSTFHNEKPFEMKYDKLVIGVGSRNNTFGIKGVEENANFLKELHHAREIRQKIIECFERASLPDVSTEERERLLSFVIVGGGATGIEFTSELNDFFSEDLSRLFPFVPVNEVKIILLEASGKILSTFDQKLVKKALINFRNSGIDVRTHSSVKEVLKDYVILDNGDRIPYGLLVWSTGIGQHPLVKNSSFEKDSHDRIIVDDHLRVKNYSNVFSFGDCANVENKNYPPTAQVASQSAVYLAKEFNNLEKLNPNPPKPFAFKFLGLLAYTGKKSGILQTDFFDLSGFIGFITWRSAYLTRLGSLRSKIQVPFDWMRTLIFGRDISSF
ncbi:hypothetical protein DDB_G0270104 [Dictyostelium discoideum AX4]|uniref:Probable NADH dehydrogenase n=1 Tax=Dictyostelium discoideum TaxID=44689 RepID=NDH_DICDI|nr:hypothetical protein DDB_G0270104 [Dictyostelium discoideum AX4]Q55CD9.2 RecName: Full=Probable NADH dehydrogenase [Dictyostelium discoideum]EAL72402.2 hypothetical protein DDB_G0270104 [Dictyostelium discoideum AX4]|eukprot:XP_646542.2 hypothetical protein DDB_G0270104 [Dictyostelium discoideum AX4]